MLDVQYGFFIAKNGHSKNRFKSSVVFALTDTKKGAVDVAGVFK